MSAQWWEKAYPGGPMVVVAGFPRPLYPPDAAPAYKPSDNGPDAEAYKRVVSRLGRWPWGTFDRAFSNGFSHGRSGNVGETGVAGVQRQSGIQPSGYIGQSTFNLFRSAKIPAGLPHAGEYAMDATAVKLINEAYTKFHSPGVTADLGPVYIGGRSVLDQDCTHATSGIPLYPAFDDAFSQGVTIIAPEAIEVTRASSSNPGQAFYADAQSGLRYWFGHLDRTPSVGTRYAKGATIGKTCVNNVGGGPHVHVGVNVERLWGTGKQLTHHTNYTHGAPTIGAQLNAGGPLYEDS